MEYLSKKGLIKFYNNIKNKFDNFYKKIINLEFNIKLIESTNDDQYKEIYNLIYKTDDLEKPWRSKPCEYDNIILNDNTVESYFIFPNLVNNLYSINGEFEQFFLFADRSPNDVKNYSFTPYYYNEYKIKSSGDVLNNFTGIQKGQLDWNIHIPIFKEDKNYILEIKNGKVISCIEEKKEIYSIIYYVDVKEYINVKIIESGFEGKIIKIELDDIEYFEENVVFNEGENHKIKIFYEDDSGIFNNVANIRINKYTYKLDLSNSCYKNTKIILNSFALNNTEYCEIIYPNNYNFKISDINLINSNIKTLNLSFIKYSKLEHIQLFKIKEIIGYIPKEAIYSIIDYDDETARPIIRKISDCGGKFYTIYNNTIGNITNPINVLLNNFLYISRAYFANIKINEPKELGFDFKIFCESINELIITSDYEQSLQSDFISNNTSKKLILNCPIKRLESNKQSKITKIYYNSILNPNWDDVDKSIPGQTQVIPFTDITEIPFEYAPTDEY